MNKIILLNGPPGCGKDTIANMLVEKYNGVNLKFTQPIRNAVCGLLGIKDSELDAIKNNPIVEGLQYTIRDLFIDIGERLVKPNLSKDWFGTTLLNTINTQYANIELIVISDLGFIKEFEVLYNNLKDSYYIEIWKIYRPNTSFKKDSRNYIDPVDDVIVRNISNNGNVKCLQQLIDSILIN